MASRIVRIALVTVDLFAAASAIAGAIGLIVGFLNIPLSTLQGTPFADFTYPAFLLGVVVGGSALAAAAVSVFGPREVETVVSAGAGCIMVGWMSVELAMIGLDTWVQPAYLLVGVLMIGLSGWLQVTKHGLTLRPSAGY